MSDISTLRGFGAKRTEGLRAEGIRDTLDLLRFFPCDYHDCLQPLTLDRVPAGEACCFTGTLLKGPAVISGGYITRVTLESGGKHCTCMWFNMSWIARKLHEGETLVLYGRIQPDRHGRPACYNPVFETPGQITPVYRQIKSIGQKLLRDTIRHLLSTDVPEDWMAPSFLARYELPDLRHALCRIHFPGTREELLQARRRFELEEMLVWQTLFTGLRRRTPQEDPLAVNEAWLSELFGRLPYTPTGAQMRCIREIISDLNGKTLMTRLVQGDVGCGKTLIAIAALYLVARSGAQAVLMAPTEILAQQHYAQVCRLLEGSGISCGLLVGSLPAAQRREVHRQLAEGELSLAVGTHALLSEGVRFRDLRLVITDEQHRFGARQRTALEEKGARTHVLVMSATPIPRTLSMVLFGDLDLSVVDELPPGRRQVRTRVVPEERREAMYAFIREQASAGQQAYVVCRLIGKGETEFSVHSAISEAEHLREVLAPARVGLVHGKMKKEEQEEVLRRFRGKDIHVLVATTVIEVGVDVPDATIMVIEDAAGFGLAQLHQLRGRVGRGNLESWCFLMAEKNERLACLCATSNGFEIAETDLRLRGAGEYFGAQQHGQGRFPAELFTGDSAAALQTREAFEILRDQYPEMLKYLQGRAREYAASEGILTSVN